MQAVSCYQLQQKGEMFLCHLFFLKMFLPWLNVATVVYSDYSVSGSHILYVVTSWPEGILVVPFCMPSVFSI